MSNPTSASAGLSGRELALERRKALSRNGKAAVKQNGQTKGVARSAAAARQRQAERSTPVSEAPSQARESETHTKESVAPAAAAETPGRPPEPGTHAGASNGRQAALERRRQMAQKGKKAVGRSNTRASALGGMARAGSERSRQLDALSQTQGVEVDCENMSGREICRLRRQALSTAGKKAMAPEARREDVLKGRVVATASKSQPERAASTEPEEGLDAAGVDASAAVERGLDNLCQTVESDDQGATPKPMMSEVRAICMARREAMAQSGKKAMRRRFNGSKGRGSLPQEGAWKAAKRQGMSTREIARQRREELCKIGRGSSDPARPCGRPRPQEGTPAKVEDGTTLAGTHVSGTQVERTPGVTGGEAGSCSSVTGTEYLGLEHYERYCRVQPEARAPKVGHTHTARGGAVSGTEVGRSPRVTGDESGTCEAITGTEYLASEQFESFCGTRPAAPAPRTGVMPTAAGSEVSGTRVGRSPRVTGDESGSCQGITGTEYLNVAASEVPCQGKDSGAPTRMGVMHTLRGRELTGTEVGRSVKVTGDESGSCQPVSGTEYLGSEQFETVCGTRPEPGPAKVSVAHTDRQQGVTGIHVGRSPTVTGDETGSCAALTGTPYYNKADFGDVCKDPAAGGVPKVGVMHTLRGREVSGTPVEHSPRVTGDEYGGCKPITGTEYVGSDHYAAFCGTRPQGGAEKVSVGRTWHQQSVSGTAMGHSGRVTGDEYGACEPISGSSYVGRDQYEQFCEPQAIQAAQERVAEHHATPGHPVSGSQPGYNHRVTGTEEGQCQDVSGAPYVGADEFARVCPTPSPELHPRLRPEGADAAVAAPEPAAATPARAGGFSVQSPARQALERRERQVTGTAYGATGGITGPSNKANGLVSGTEEFRYSPQRETVVGAQTEEEAPKTGAERVTVNGSSNGVTITGDDWGRGSGVTGTEGLSTRRNATLKGHPRGEGRSAYANRELERKEVPPSRITGSSGNSGAGSLVTLSGGARG